MNELFDKLILRFAFTIVVCLMLYLYKYAHAFLYPSIRQQMFQSFSPSKNSPKAIHLFSRIIGLGLIFSEFYFKLNEGISLTIVDFFIRAVLSFFVYIISLYVIESIVLYNFEYSDEIIKRKNYAYALVAAAHSIGLAFIIKAVLKVSGGSFVMLLLLWLFSLVLVGFATKTFPIMSKLPFNRLIIQKNMAVALSYSGFFIGWSLIVCSAFNNKLIYIKWYAIQAILKILLTLIILPVFMKGLKFVFKIKDEMEENIDKDRIDYSDIESGYGLYEGAVFLTACYLTIVITGRIHFGTFYPVF
jgi:uncharacterized membrane protein YjfL (UPF0719 family)